MFSAFGPPKKCYVFSDLLILKMETINGNFSDVTAGELFTLRPPTDGIQLAMMKYDSSLGSDV